MAGVENVWEDKPIGTTDDDNPKTFFVRDLYDVRHTECILANFSTIAKRQSSTGTVFEVGYAKALGKTIVTVGPLQNMPLFVQLAADIHFETIDEAVKYLGDFK